MATIVPQSELTRRAIDWLCEQGVDGTNLADLRKRIESASQRFNLGPLEEEFLERFFRAAVNGENKS